MISHSGLIYQYKPIPNETAAPLLELVGAYEHTVSKRDATQPMSKNVRKNRTLTGLVAGGIIGLFVLLSPLLYIEAQYRIAQMRNLDPDQQVKDLVANAVSIPTPTPRTIVSAYNVDLNPTPTPVIPQEYGALLNQTYLEVLKPVDTQFSVIIPKIGVNSTIVPDVDVSNEQEYRNALKSGVAHAKGSFVPGQNGTTYVFAHSTDYVWNIQQFNAVFFHLREMQVGDQIYVVYKNKVYPYKVKDTRIVDPGETYFLKPKKGEEELILQTCWPPGTTTNRLLVFAEPGGSVFE